MTLSLNLDAEPEAPKTRSKKGLLVILLAGLILLAFWGYKSWQASARSVKREVTARAAIIQTSNDLKKMKVGSSERRRLFIQLKEACDIYRGSWPATEPAECPK